MSGDRWAKADAVFAFPPGAMDDCGEYVAIEAMEQSCGCWVAFVCRVYKDLSFMTPWCVTPHMPSKGEADAHGAALAGALILARAEAEKLRQDPAFREGFDRLLGERELAKKPKNERTH